MAPPADPIAVTANVTNGTVPMDVNFTAAIAGAPANATAAWTLSIPDGPLLQQSSTASNLTQSWLDVALNAPGWVHGDIQVLYPVTSLVYAEVGLPWITVAPLAIVSVSHTPLVGYAPWNVTFWANATNVTGGLIPAEHLGPVVLPRPAGNRSVRCGGRRTDPPYGESTGSTTLVFEPRPERPPISCGPTE